MTATMLSTANTPKIDFNAIITRAKNGERLTVKHLSKELKMKSIDLRKALVAQFGANIVFKRGRTGGIAFTI